MITSKTSFLALIGDPVNHSLSPIIQNAALQYLNLDLVYLAIPCKEKDLKSVINSLKMMNCKGLNITIPFKEKVFSLCSEISTVATQVKAINTLKLNEYKEWSGTNTDVEGFIHPLKDINLFNKTAIILGSGGAARSVAQGLIDLKFSRITIISRNKNSTENLIDDFKNQIKINAYTNDSEQIMEIISSIDLIVNTTPVGMKLTPNKVEQIPFGKNFWKSIQSNTVVYDLIYNPSPTPFLKLCQNKGCTTIDGIQMLIAQGAKSLSYWTNGLEIPLEVMEKAIKIHIKNNLNLI